MGYQYRTHLRNAGLLLILCSAASAQYTITEYSSGLTAGSLPGGIAVGSDGALWFTEDVGRIGRIAPTPPSAAQSVPILSPWTMLLLAALLATAGAVELRPRSRRA